MAAGKGSLKNLEQEFEKENSNETKKGAATAPKISSYNPARAKTNSRLINARIGEQNRGRHNVMSGMNGIFETSLHFTNLATSTIEGADGKLYCRVTELDSGLPAAGAQVRFLRNPYVLKVDRSKKSDGTMIDNVIECADATKRESIGANEGENVYYSPVFTTDALGLVAIPAAQLKPQFDYEAKKDFEDAAKLQMQMGISSLTNVMVVSQNEDTLYCGKRAAWTVSKQSESFVFLHRSTFI